MNWSALFSRPNSPVPSVTVGGSRRSNGSSSGSSSGKAHAKRASGTDAALHRDVATEEIHQAPRHAQAQAASAHAPRRVLVDLPERFEHVLEVLRRNADAGVG